MKKNILFFIGLFASIGMHANVNFIDVGKMGGEARLEHAFGYIKENVRYYEVWSNEWNYSVPKQELVRNLRSEYNTFNAVETKGAEVHLLLGDIAHYLYNLDDTAFFSKAVMNYGQAITLSPSDYRGYWFLGQHYALSNCPELAVANFKKAQTLLTANQSSEFWEDFASTMAMANMPSHCIYAMDRVRSVSGKMGRFEVQLGPKMRERIEPVDKARAYKKEDIWTGFIGEKTTFVCRPLGLRLEIDSTWGVSIFDYNRGQAVFMMSPAEIKNKNGRAISYSIAILMKTAGDEDQLEDYLNTFISRYPTKKKIAFSTKYDKMVAYEIQEKSMYQDMGGAHMYMVGVERDAPDYPGLLLESPAPLPQGEVGRVSYYTAAKSMGRFKGKIFYAVLLDSCEDINPESLAVFKKLFEQQLVIE